MGVNYMVLKKQIEETFEDIDDIDVRPSRRPSKSKKNNTQTHKTQKVSPRIDVMALIEEKTEEDRTEVMSIRITPTSRKKIEQIWLDQRKKRKKLKESTVAAEILMKVLEHH